MSTNETKPLSLYFDIDDETNINEFCQKLCSTYCINTVYLNKSSYIDAENPEHKKYHIFVPQVVYSNVLEMKKDVIALVGKLADDMVYSCNNLLRLPF